MGDPSVKSMKEMLVKANWGVVYRYKFGSVVEEISFTPEELAQM